MLANNSFEFRNHNFSNQVGPIGRCKCTLVLGDWDCKPQYECKEGIKGWLSLNCVANVCEQILVAYLKCRSIAWEFLETAATHYQGRQCTYNVTLWLIRILFIPTGLS